MYKYETGALNRGLRVALLASLILSAGIGVFPYSSLAALVRAVDYIADFSLDGH